MSRESCCATGPQVCGPTSTITRDTTSTRSWSIIITQPNIYPGRPKPSLAKVLRRLSTGMTNTARNSKARTAVRRVCSARWTITRVRPDFPSRVAHPLIPNTRFLPAMGIGWITHAFATTVGPLAAAPSRQPARALSKHDYAAAACAGLVPADNTSSVYAPT